MKKAHKELAIDLLKALDFACHGKLRAEEEYKLDLVISSKDLVRATKYLVKQGYRKVEGV